MDVVLETSHHSQSREHEDLYREHIDMPVLKSILCDHEELLLNDGCTGVAVLNPSIPVEVQFDEHKLLIVYGEDLSPFEEGAPRQQRPLHGPDEVHHRGQSTCTLRATSSTDEFCGTEDPAGHGFAVLLTRR